jgi:hypothetical protein
VNIPLPFSEASAGIQGNASKTGASLRLSPICGLPACSTPARRIYDQRLAGCGKTRSGALWYIGILPASHETKGVAGWKPALPPAPKEFFRRLP